MTISDLLAAHQKSVKAIEDSYQMLAGTLSKFDDEDIAFKIRIYARMQKIGSSYLDSIETLLGLIEANLKAAARLADEEIDGMRWERVSGGGIGIDHRIRYALNEENRVDLTGAHNSCIDKLHAEILRLRAAKGADRG